MTVSAPKLLAGKVAIVTGGGAGLGKKIAQTFAKYGGHGAVLDIDDKAIDLSAPDGWLPIMADVTDETSLAEAIRKAAAHFGRIDVVVANAGLVPRWAPVADLDFDLWDRIFAVNVRGVAATIKHSIPYMKPHGGSIIAMASTSAWRARAGQCLYTATKHAVLGIVRASAQDLGPAGIRVNALGPGPVATDAMRGRIEARQDITNLNVTAAIDSYGAETALGRIATEDDVAQTAGFLASDLSAGITGTLVPVDCGWP